MITEQDITRLKKVFVTKEDAKAFAKKKDLQKLVTKRDHDADIARIVKHMATKEDLKKLEERLEEKLEQKLEQKLEEKIDQKFEQKFEQFQEKFDRIVTIVEKVIAPIDTLRLEAAVSAAQYQRQLEWNHKVGAKIRIPFEY